MKYLNIEHRDKFTTNTLNAIDIELDRRNTLDDMIKGKYGEYLNEFLQALNKEIKKVYLFYVSIERELYLQINTILHHLSSYQY